MELYASETTLMSEVTDYSMRRCIIASQDVVLYRYVSIYNIYSSTNICPNRTCYMY
jgi:hypothetical protein